MPYIGKYLKIRKYKKAGSINTYNCQFWTIFLFLSRLFFFLYNFFDWLFDRIVLSPAAAVLFTAPTLHSLLLLNRFLKLLSLNHDNTSLLNMLFLLIMHLKKTQTCVKYTFRHLLLCVFWLNVFLLYSHKLY